MPVNVRIHMSVRKKIWFAGAKQQLQMRSGGLRFMSRVVSQHRQSYIFNTAHLARYYVLLERLINSLASIYHISIFVFFFENIHWPLPTYLYEVNVFMFLHDHIWG